ncbi:MAG: maleylpyruvate isomerase family mycothiol-dependent enzyme [Nitrososphaerales archaeon]
MRSSEIWSELHRLRCELADRIQSLEPEQWEASSWCTGWRVRDVLAHLVHLAEATQLSMVRDVLRGGGRPDRALSRIARQLGREPVPDLAGRLRIAAKGRFHVVGLPPAVTLGEVLVHGADALGPFGMSMEVPTRDVVPVLDVYRRVGRFAFHAAPNRGLRLVASDTDWQSGSGPEVRGRAVDLLLLMANRRQALPALDGPGVATASERWAAA